MYVDANDIGSANGEYMYNLYRPGQTRNIGQWMKELLFYKVGYPSETRPLRWFTLQNYFDYDNGNNPSTEQADIWYDDIYIQFGTRSRVVIGDNADYLQCTFVEMQTPTVWNATGITFTLNHGVFSATDTAYIFVITDDEEQLWNTGYAFTVGNAIE